MSRLASLVALSRATKLAYKSSTDPDERKQLEIIGGRVARMIGLAVVGESKRTRNSNTSTETTS